MASRSSPAQEAQAAVAAHDVHVAGAQRGALAAKVTEGMAWKISTAATPAVAARIAGTSGGERRVVARRRRGPPGRT